MVAQEFEPKLTRIALSHTLDGIQVRSKSAGHLWGESSSLSVCGMLAQDSTPGSNKKLLSKFDQATSLKFPGISKGHNDVKTVQLLEQKVAGLQASRGVI